MRTDPSQPFVVHPAVARAIGQGWNLELEGVKLLDLLSPHKTCMTYAVWTARLVTTDSWVWIRALVFHDTPEVHFWFRTGNGVVGNTSPLVKGRPLKLKVGDISERYLIGMSSVTELAGRGHMDHVQITFGKTSMPFFTRDFDIGGDYAPLDGTQTGGNWPYMGITHPEKPIEEWREELYPLARYGGAFMHRSIMLWSEGSNPDMVGAAYPRDRSKDKGWIKWTDPDTPWKDKDDTRIVEPDRQHLTVWRALAQASMQHPWDQGLAMELELRAHYLLRQIPGRDKGGTYHKAGTHRAQGRELLVLVAFYKALEQQGLPRLADDIGIRAWERFQIQIKRWKANKLVGGEGHPWTLWENRAFSPSEIGIHYWGLRELDEILDMNAILLSQKDMTEMKMRMRKFCFDAFREWSDFPDAGYSIPYYINLDGTDSGSPSGGDHFAWLAAMDYAQDIDDMELTRKKRALRAMRPQIPVRFRG